MLHNYLTALLLCVSVVGTQVCFAQGGNPLPEPDPEPLPCIIADRQESCSTEFGLQAAGSCAGCINDNTACPSGNTWATPNPGVSVTSWAKGRAAAVRPAASGYWDISGAATNCGDKGSCSALCLEQDYQGQIFHSCPKIPSSGPVVIYYFNLHNACNPQPPEEEIEVKEEQPVPE